VTEGALAGVRVLGLEQAAAGPFATHLLADMGAEVIKVERPGGDVIRGWDSVVDGLSTGFVWLNRNKKSVVVDASLPQGREVLRRLAAASDAVVSNLGPGVADRLGVGYEELAAEHPELVYCNVSGFGASGPWRDRKAYDLLMQAETGILATTGYPDAPAKVGVPIADLAAGLYAALGVVLALRERDRTGRGQLVDISMFEAMLEWLGYFPHHCWHGREAPSRVGMRHHSIVPYGPYRAGDGRYVVLAVASAEDWRRFCEVLERPDLVDDPRFAGIEDRRANRAELEELVERELGRRDSVEWMTRLDAVGLQSGSVRSIPEVLEHPQVEARGAVRSVPSPVGEIPTIESPLRLSESGVATGAIPGLGEHTDAVLAELGFDDSELASLRREGAIAG
jgi:crotonobetainyl-CoA:carnitine CoA-transferase CaiB-like acyl-CoA transferase